MARRETRRPAFAARALRVFAQALCAVALVLSAAGAAWAQARGDDGLLKVPPLARVVDLAGALDATAKSNLENKLAAFETAHGSQIAIVVVPSTKPEEISDFAFRVGGEWKIGRAGVGDGVLIVVATQDRRAFIAVARALEGAIPDVLARRIVREQMAPFFKDGNFGGGLSAALDAIFRLVEGERLPPPRDRTSPLPDIDGGIGNALFPLIIVGFLIGRALRRRIGVTGSLLAGGGTGATAALLLSSLALGGLAGLAVFFLSFVGGSGGGRVLGGRRGGIFIPGGWSGGGWSSGGGGWGGGGGWSSGGGGDFSGGGAGGDW